MTATTANDAARDAFLAIQALARQWYDKEREGIALIEGFQTALLACRAGMPASTSASSSRSVVGSDSARHKTTTQTEMDVFVHGGDSTSTGVAGMDPWLLEELYAEVKELQPAFEKLLEEMYDHDAVARTQVLALHEPHHQPSPDSLCGNALSCADYMQFIAHELAAFEAEFQHIEALLAIISFEITTDQLRTLVISWSTSPFLEPARSKSFRQRHDLANIAVR